MTSIPCTGRRPGYAAGSVRPTLLTVVRLTTMVGLAALTSTAAADIMPTARRTTWNPGIPGGIPARNTVCATVQASTYGNGTQDATAGIQSAINACPDGQVVQLSAGNFLINGSGPIFISKSITVRGMGPALTKLRKTNSPVNPLFIIGERWLNVAGTTNLTANAPKGAMSVQVASTTGLTVGRLVEIDEITDNTYVNWGPNCPPGDQCRSWFTRNDRAVGQMLEIASISGNTVTFTTPLHIAFDTAHTAQLVRYTIPYGARYAGLEDVYLRGGLDDNVAIRFAMYSWIKGIESDWSDGDSVAMDMSFRCVIRDSYIHDTPKPFPGGGGYLLSMATYTADGLVENNIFMHGNKVMVMRSAGGGNVIGYNYFDDGEINYAQGWMETGMNASHMAEPHFELFEGNQAFNIDGDNTWGGAYTNTFFRNHATGKRRSFADTGNRRAVGLMFYHYNYSFVGNVLGTSNQNPSPFSGFMYQDYYPWDDDPIPMWKLGYNPENWNAPAEQRVLDTTFRHANWDYATDSNDWTTGYDTTLPNSLYLTAKPSFFGTLPWPWVDATGPTKLFTLPARARYDGGTPNATRTLTVLKAGTGSGTVTSSPNGINCGATCTATYPEGTPVTLTAVPQAGHTFAGWSGACTGTGTCQVPMTAATVATATFTTGVSHALTVTRAGAGTGTVTSAPAGINCGTTCTTTFLQGTAVTLTATPAAGSAFTGWSGACSGTGTCPLTMDTAKSVTATFHVISTTYVLTVNRKGRGTGTVSSSPAGINCGTTCSASFTAGAVVTLTATPTPPSKFGGWRGACAGVGRGPCQVTIGAPTTATAVFLRQHSLPFGADEDEVVRSQPAGSGRER